MADRVFDSSLYPFGARCSCCLRLFVDGDPVVDREAPDAVWDGWHSTPTCVGCAEAGAPLVADHPFLRGGPVALLADGTIGAGRV